MRKIISGLLCLILLCALAVGVSAASARMSLLNSADTVHRGEKFTITVILTNDQPVKSGGVVLDYDKNVFEIIGGSCKVSNVTLGEVSASKNGGVFALQTEAVVSGTIFTIQMQVKADAPLGNYVISGTPSLSVPCTLGGCKVTVACNHNYKDFTLVSATVHKSVCSICGEEKTTNHTWNNGSVIQNATCQASGLKNLTCTACGATTQEAIPKTAHNGSGYTDEGASGHKFTCKDCGNTFTEGHVYADAWEHDAQAHFHKCSNCSNITDSTPHVPGPEATETTDQTCTVCSRVLQVHQRHEHTFSEEWFGDENNHWHACVDCDTTQDNAPHIYDNDCDSDCNLCATTREPQHKLGSWISDDDSHWKLCETCGKMEEQASHTPSEEEFPNCTVCNQKLPVNHPHQYGKSHSHTCACGEVYANADGECKICKTFPWWTVCIVEAVIFGVIVLVIILKRKKD